MQLNRSICTYIQLKLKTQVGDIDFGVKLLNNVIYNPGKKGIIVIVSIYKSKCAYD